MVNAPIDGLLPGDYMPGERSLARNLEPKSPALAQVDMELTAGLMRYIRDAREGRYDIKKQNGSNQRLIVNKKSDLDVVPLAITVANAPTIDEGLERVVNQDSLYKLIRRLGKRRTQFLNAEEFDAYRVTMESLRSDPVNIGGSGKYLVSNIAAQEVLAMRDGRVELGMNMVVGRPTRQTPVRDDTIVSVKFSPDWTAPKSIVRKDLIPKAPQIFKTWVLKFEEMGRFSIP